MAFRRSAAIAPVFTVKPWGENPHTTSLMARGSIVGPNVRNLFNPSLMRILKIMEERSAARVRIGAFKC